MIWGPALNNRELQLLVVAWDQLWPSIRMVSSWPLLWQPGHLLEKHYPNQRFWYNSSCLWIRRNYQCQCILTFSFHLYTRRWSNCWWIKKSLGNYTGWVHGNNCSICSLSCILARPVVFGSQAVASSAFGGQVKPVTPRLTSLCITF